jgi:hypothetical protein
MRWIAVAGFALAVATSARGMTPAPIPQPDSLITPVIAGCGPGGTMVNGVCVARTPDAPSAGVCDGQEALALCTNETPDPVEK